MYGDLPFDSTGPVEGPVLIAYSILAVSTFAVYSGLALLIASRINNRKEQGCAGVFAFFLIPSIWNLLLCLCLMNTYSIEYQWILLIIIILILCPMTAFHMVWKIEKTQQRLPGGLIASMILGIMCYIPAMITPEAHDPFFENLINGNMVMGDDYRTAQMVRRNWKKADELDWQVIGNWLPKAEKGEPKAMDIVARHYSHIKGQEQNAFYWWQKGAEAGDKDAQYALGMHYSIGRIVDQDLGKSHYWLLKAEANGKELPREVGIILGREKDQHF